MVRIGPLIGEKLKKAASFVAVAGDERRRSASNVDVALKLKRYKSEIFTDVHRIDSDTLCKRLETNKITGLSSEKAKLFLALQGFNELKPFKQTPLYWKLIKILFHGTSLLLWFGTALCFLSVMVVYANYKYYDYDNILLGIMLIVIIVLTSGFTYMQERRGSRIMESFETMIPANSIAIRDGKRQSIPSRDLVVGDLIEIKSGDRIPADVRILEARNFKVDNSPITGESHSVYLSTQCTSDHYSDTKNIAFFSTCAVEGFAKGLVIFCGEDTLMGRVANLSERIEPNKAPIAKDLDVFMKYTVIWSSCLGITFGLIAYKIGYSWLEALLFLIGLVVANVPEGLMATITLCLTITAKKLAKDNCLIKNLDVIETLGITSVICSDKTGTITENKMQVNHVWFNNELYTEEEEEETQTEKAQANLASKKKTFIICNEFLRTAVLCTSAEFINSTKENGELIGDASEIAILNYFIEKHNVDCSSYQKNYPKLIEKPFNSTNKYQLSVHSLDSGRCLLVMKGAPEVILERCSTMLLHNKSVEFSKELKEANEDACVFLAMNGERVLGFCDLELEKQYSRGYPFKVYPSTNFPDTGLRFLGFIAMVDPPRNGVFEAITDCKIAGIQVIMLTGDHPVTAKAIARQVGIINEFEKESDESTPLLQTSNSIVITGTQLRELSSEKLYQLLKNYKEIVFARVTPTQKLEVVEALQKLGNIVAVTGDGVNDSLALKKADIGIAMGLCGTQVSHQSADIILLDDNFSSIVKGIEEGRKTFDNMKKAIVYILTSNIAQITPYIAFVLLNIPLPLGITAVLSVDVLTDMLPAISLAYEESESNIMMIPPRNPKKDMLVTCKTYFYAYGHMGIIESAAGFFTYFMIMAECGFTPKSLIGVRKDWDNANLEDIVDAYGQEWTYKGRKALEYTCSSAYMISVIVMQLANIIACKTRYNSSLSKGIYKNHFLLVSLLIEILIACFLIYTPGMKILKLFPVKWYWWFYSFPFAAFMIAFDEWRKWNLRKRRRRKHPYFEATFY